MEGLLKQLIVEMQDFRSEVKKRFDDVDHRFDGVGARFNEVNARFNGVEEQLRGVDARFNEVEEQLRGVDAQFEKVNGRLDRLEIGQEELNKTLKHNTTLMIENFTDIRKETRTKIKETQADVDLLFKEVEEVKRKTNKIEQQIKS